MTQLKSLLLAAAALILTGPLLSAQKNISVSGKVVSSQNGETLPGVSVVVKGAATATGTITDLDGLFSISAPDGTYLQFLCMGMKTVEMKVNPSMAAGLLTVRMEDDTEYLQEVVVVGYGTQRKQSVVGSISQVKSDEIAKAGGVTNISNALTGLVPGMVTLNYSGKPGEDDAEIIIRSKSTWNGSAPLVLVDGIERSMNEIDVAEVESISVLKDASATAVFGVRGGNGVVLVTTKRGKEGKPTMTASANVTAKTVSKVPDNLNSYDALRLRNIAIENQLAVSPSSWSYITPVEILQKYRDQSDPYLYPDVDWTEEMVRDYSFSQRYNWDIKGGTKFVKYYGSLAYLYDGDVLKGQDLGQGYVPTNDYSRFNYRINLDFMPTKLTTISVDLDGATGVESSTNAGAAYLWRGVYYKGPDQYPVRYQDGTFANNENGYNMYNPVELLNYSGVTKDTRMDANVSVSLNQKLSFITKGLSFRALVNFRNFYYSTGPTISASRPVTKYIDPITGNVVYNIPSSWSSSSGFEFDLGENTVTNEKSATNVYKNFLYQASLGYSRVFDSKHNVGGLALFKRIETSTGSAFATYREEWAGRITYDYCGRYLLEANAAYNGSEKFASGYKFGFFPSLAAGWVISDEKWMRGLMGEWLDLLKLRYSWGRVGSDNNIPKWLYVTQWSKITNAAKFGYPSTSASPYPTYEVSNIGNADAKWETSVKNDFAVETSAFGNRLSLNADFFWGRRYDIFMNASQRNIPPWFGADPIAANIGRTHEWGSEYELRWNHKLAGGFSYYLTAMYSTAHDVIDYMEDSELAPAYQKKAGFPIGQQTTILSNGIIKSWDDMYTSVASENNSQAIIGMYRLVDYNGDGIVDTDDVVPYGYSNHPQQSMNISLGASWRNLSLSLQIYGSRGCTLVQTESEFSSPHYYSVVDKGVAEDMWIPGVNESGTHHIASFMLSGSAASTCQYYLKDGTQWRLKSAELSYKLDSPVLKGLGINRLNIYLNGNNLLLYSHLNEDRETGGKRENTHTSSYPITKRVNLGVKVEF